MEQILNEIEINGIEYVRKDSINEFQKVEKINNLEYVLVRTYSAGVFVGYLKEKKDKEVTLLNARRIWYWDGAASLSQLAMDGTSKPENCKFPCYVVEITLLEAIEIIPMSKKAKDSIDSVKVWEE